MTDTTVAPAGSAPPAAQNEVPINENPTASPTPLGQQAPDKPVGDLKGSEHRPPSRREAIQKAFERANNPQPKTAKPAQKAPVADAKPGHNKPPEETPEGLDLKKSGPPTSREATGGSPHTRAGPTARIHSRPRSRGHSRRGKLTTRRIASRRSVSS